MYLDHFRLCELPFSLTPDTSFFYDRGTHQEALNVLLLALRSGEGFMKITGEVGTGKTLLCRKLLGALDGDYVTAYIHDPYLNAHALRRAVGWELGLEREASVERQARCLTEHLLALSTAGKRVVVLIDEAQALADDSLEAVRLLTNLETERHKLLQVVLFGQPELDARLAQPHLRQLKQRISFSYALRPLDRAGVEDYLNHRLQVAGYRGRSLLTPGAVRLLARASRGIPRLVNILCHKALMAAYGQGSARVRATHLRRAIADTDDTRGLVGGPLRVLRYTVLGALSAALTGMGLRLVPGTWR